MSEAAEHGGRRVAGVSDGRQGGRACQGPRRRLDRLQREVGPAETTAGTADDSGGASRPPRCDSGGMILCSLPSNGFQICNGAGSLFQQDLGRGSPFFLPHHVVCLRELLASTPCQCLGPGRGRQMPL